MEHCREQNCQKIGIYCRLIQTWLLVSGPLPSTSTNVTTVSAAMLNVLIQHKMEKVDLERFWKEESMGVTETETTTTDVNSYDAYESGINLQGWPLHS